LILDTREKEKLIETLLESGLTWDQIAKRAHVLPNRIKKVRDRLDERLAPKVKSDRSKAFQMYKAKRTPNDVVIDLDITAQDAEKYELEYWRLTGMAGLEQMYLDNEESIQSMIDLHDKLRAMGLTRRKALEYLEMLKSIDDLESKKEALQGNIWLRESRLRVLREEISSQTKKIGDLQDANRVEQEIILKESERWESALGLKSNKFDKIDYITRKLARKALYGTGSSH
jgi:hypothetical protein